MPAIYYNEIDPFAAQWIHNLITEGHLPNGYIDTKDICAVKAAEVRGYAQCHFFAGIGGWPYALRLAGWPTELPVWTGSCPCQPFSQAGRHRGGADDRHLWPTWFTIIRECRPPIIFGEQVASRLALEWLDAVSTDLEREGYALGAADLCAASVGAPHIRQRFYFVAYLPPERYGNAHVVGDACGERSGGDGRAVSTAQGEGSERGKTDRPLTHKPEFAGHTCRSWANADRIWCRDNKARPVESGTFPLAHGLPRSLGSLQPRIRKLAEVAGLDGSTLREAKADRTGRIRGYGNAIVPELAAAFIQTVLNETTLP